MIYEQRSVLYKNITINYILTRKKVKNINLRVYPDGQVKVSAQNSVKISAIEKFILSHGDKILTVSKNSNDSVEKKNLLSNSYIYILGKKINVSVDKSPNNKDFAFLTHNNIQLSDYLDLDFWRNNEDLLDINLSVYVSDISDPVIIQKVINKWLNIFINTIFDQVCREVHLLFVNMEFPTIKSRKMTSRWGSCSPQKMTIILSKSLIHKPLLCVNYVILHEFCHLIHPNHSPDFYNLVGSFMPDWKDYNNLLNSN